MQIPKEEVDQWATLHSPNENGTTKFHDRCNHHGLHHGQRPRRDGGRERVGDIVGTNVPGIEKSKDDADGKDVVKLVKNHGCGSSPCLSLCLSLSAGEEG